MGFPGHIGGARKGGHNKEGMRRLVMKKLFVILVAITFLLMLPTEPVNSQGRNYLRISSGQQVKGLNPFNPSFNDVYSSLIKRSMWEPLYMYTPDFTENPAAKDLPDKRLMPWMAESMPTWKKAGDLWEVTVPLRKDIKWWDGKKLTADDVVFTADLMLNYEIPAHESTYWKVGGEFYVKAVEKVDDYTVKFILNELVPIFFTVGPLTSMSIYPQHQWQPIVDEAIAKYSKGGGITDEVKDLVASEVWSVNVGRDIPFNKLVGSGSFKPGDWRQGEYIRMDANKNYWAKGRKVTINGKEYTVGPYIDGYLRVVYKSPDASTLAMKNGDVDITGIMPADIPDFLSKRNMKIENYTGNSIFYISFNLRKKPMSYHAFREAIAYIWDKEMLNERIYQGRSPPIYSTVPFVNEFWYNPDVPVYGKDMSKVERQYKAYQTLKEGGFKWGIEPVFRMEGGKPVAITRLGNNLIMPDGQKCPEIELLGASADEIPDQAQAYTMMQQWMREIGMPIKYTPIDFGTAIDRIYPNDGSEPRFDMQGIVGWTLDPDPNHFLDLWHSSQRPEITPGGANGEGYNNSEYDQLAEASAREMDPEKRKDMIFELQEIVAEDLPVLPTTTITRIQVYRTDRFKNWFNMPMYGIIDRNNIIGLTILQPV